MLLAQGGKSTGAWHDSLTLHQVVVVFIQKQAGGDIDHPCCSDAIQQGKRKMSDQFSSNFETKHRSRFRVRPNCEDGAINFVQKTVTKAWELLFIILSGCVHFIFGSFSSCSQIIGINR